MAARAEQEPQLFVNFPRNFSRIFSPRLCCITCAITGSICLFKINQNGPFTILVDWQALNFHGGRFNIFYSESIVKKTVGENGFQYGIRFSSTHFVQAHSILCLEIHLALTFCTRKWFGEKWYRKSWSFLLFLWPSLSTSYSIRASRDSWTMRKCFARFFFME